MLTRRQIILGVSGSGLALAGCGTAFVVTRTPSRALAAWDTTAVTVADVRLDAFRHAILAPNPHNRQPWTIELVGTQEAVIRCDLERRLPHTDPFDRQITIGFGCFLELARIAAATRGVRMETMPFPDGAPGERERLDKRPIAHLKFVPDASVKADPHYKAIAIRRSSKVPFDVTRPIAEATLAAMRDAAAAETTVDPVLVAKLKQLTWDAWMLESKTPRTMRESVELMRVGKAEIERNPDGIALGGAMIETLALTGAFSPHAMLDPNSSSFKAGADRYRPILANTPGYAWITTAGNSRRDQLDAGRRYVRLNLAAVGRGIAVHPVSQALQEFAEMAALFTAVRDALSVPAANTLQMLARIGYAPMQSPTPRWPLEQKLIRT